MNHRSWMYPMPERPVTVWESLAAGVGMTVGYCPVCQQYTLFSHWTSNFRESGLCVRCGSFNRQRQVALVVHRTFRLDRRYASLGDNRLAVLNKETRGSLHRQLLGSAWSHYYASEYLGPEVEPGQIIGGVRHEDVQRLSFESDSLDLVLSSDVWEHVPGP